MSGSPTVDPMNSCHDGSPFGAECTHVAIRVTNNELIVADTCQHKGESLLQES